MENRMEDRRLYEELHGGHAPAPALLSRLVEDSPDYSAFSRPAEPPRRPETLLPPAPSSYQSSGLGAELGAGRHKRYPSVDYAPQQDYSPAPAPFYPAEPFQPAPYQPRPTPQPAFQFGPQPRATEFDPALSPWILEAKRVLWFKVERSNLWQ